ncbi:MAG: glycosyltransferase [Lactovum sp.]
MKFFINASFNKQNSGIEHAQLKRAQLFRDHDEEFKLVFREWNPRLHYFLKEVGVDSSESLCMFDFFQRAELIEDKIVHAEDIDFGVDGLSYFEKENENHYVVQREQQIIARVHYFVETDEKRVSMIELFDGFGQLYRVDNYDMRGFMSLAQWYTPDNMIGTEVWYDVNGKPVVETFNKLDGNGKMVKLGWRLTYDENGAVYSFDNIDKLTQHFFDRINNAYWSEDELNIFVLDRTHLGDWSVLDLERPAYIVLHLHNSHAGDAQDVMHSVTNNFYEYSLMNMNRYDAVVSATHKQTADVIARFDPKCAMFTIPVGVIPNEVLHEEPISMSDRKPHSVLVTARVAPEKQIGHIIRSVGIAKKKIPDISFDFYGYVDTRDNNAAQKDIDAAIKEYDLQDAVHQYEYSNDVATLQKGSQVYALNSIMEGFNLSLMEAQGHGMVTVTTDVNYGPNELTVDGENGYVVSYDGVEEMADKLVELFSNDKLLQDMSDKAYELSERYSEASVWSAWKELLDHAKSQKVNYTSPISQGIGNQLKNK